MFVLDIRDVIPDHVSYKLFAKDMKVHEKILYQIPPHLLQDAADAVLSWAARNHVNISVGNVAVIKATMSNATYHMLIPPIPEVDVFRDLGAWSLETCGSASH